MSEAHLLRFGPLEISEMAREVRVSGNLVHLKPREFSLLLVLATNAGVAMSRAQLLDLVWGFDFEGGDRTLDVHIRRLRMKIEEDGRCGPCFHTLRRFGYKFAYRGQTRFGESERCVDETR
jgi:two-component system alkaline phosphatase synthesis response regulator PhoP